MKNLVSFALAAVLLLSITPVHAGTVSKNSDLEVTLIRAQSEERHNPDGSISGYYVLTLQVKAIGGDIFLLRRAGHLDEGSYPSGIHWKWNSATPGDYLLTSSAGVTSPYDRPGDTAEYFKILEGNASIFNLQVVLSPKTKNDNGLYMVYLENVTYCVDIYTPIQTGLLSLDADSFRTDFQYLTSNVVPEPRSGILLIISFVVVGIVLRFCFRNRTVPN